MKPSPIANEDWFAFRAAAEAAGIGGSTVDWDEAWMVWRTLDPAQRAGAVQGITDREGTEDYALRSLPANYLRKRMWERPVRGVKKATAADAAMREALDAL